MIDKDIILERYLTEDHICHGPHYIDDYGVYETVYKAMDEYAIALAEEAFNDGAWRDPNFIFSDTFDEFLKQHNLKRPTQK